MCGSRRRQRETKTHADCDFAESIDYQEWYDKWGRAHDREVIRCRLTSASTCGYKFNAKDPMPSECAWERIKLSQAKAKAC